MRPTRGKRSGVEHGTITLWVLGLATDYCVRFTALDAVQLGFRTHLVTDACRAVDCCAVSSGGA